MLHFYDRATMARALTLDLEPELHRLLSDRIGALSEELKDHTEYLVVQPGDTESDILRHISLSPLIEPLHGARYEEPGFHPHWDYLASHDGWFEMIFTFGSAFAYILLIEDIEEGSAPLLRLCRSYTSG